MEGVGHICHIELRFYWESFRRSAFGSVLRFECRMTEGECRAGRGAQLKEAKLLEDAAARGRETARMPGCQTNSCTKHPGHKRNLLLTGKVPSA